MRRTRLSRSMTHLYNTNIEVPVLIGLCRHVLVLFFCFGLPNGFIILKKLRPNQ
jgi:hypothetical protein